MNTVKAWLREWLGAVSLSGFSALHQEYRKALQALKSELETAQVEHETAIAKLKSEYVVPIVAAECDLVREEFRAETARLKSDHDGAMAELIEELNSLRNSIPATQAQNAGQAVRVFRNFREFRSVLENTQAIRIERKS